MQIASHGAGEHLGAHLYRTGSDAGADADRRLSARLAYLLNRSAARASGVSVYSGRKVVNKGYCQKAQARQDDDRHCQVFGVQIESVGDDKREQLGRHRCFDSRGMKDQG
jgi:hypothetical protein